MEEIVLDLTEAGASCTDNPAVRFIREIQRLHEKKPRFVIVRANPRDLPADVIAMVAERNGYMVEQVERESSTVLRVVLKLQN
ncbi:MAG: hypothetical protein ABWW70_06940 [Thermoproteota archaeon]